MSAPVYTAAADEGDDGNGHVPPAAFENWTEKGQYGC
jgi:hypothetical protein